MPNEKTLELNITYEILQFCRQSDPHAFSMGTTLIQESNVGFDSRTLARMPPSIMTSPLQYKRAKKRLRTGPNSYEYVFEINNNTYHDQQLILYHYLAGGRAQVAYYALPALWTNAEFIGSIPQLLNRTFFIDVSQIPPTIVDRRTHRIFLDPQRRTAMLRSEEKRLKVTSADEYRGLVAERKIGLPISQMLENMKKPPKDDFLPRSRRPRFLFNVFWPYLYP